MNSMTGFGRGSASRPGGRLAVEVRTVNHRGFDLKLRGRDIDATCELEITRALKVAVQRGAISVSLREDEGPSALLRTDRIKAAYAELLALRDELKIPEPVDLATVAAFLSEGRSGAGDSGGEWSWPVVRPAIESALRELLEMREREGALLAVDIRQRLARLQGLRQQIAAAAATSPAHAARRLSERVTALAAAVVPDPARIAQEIAYLAEKLDVSEELLRLGVHLEHLELLVGGHKGTVAGQVASEVGRKIEFVIQEVGRELNTIGSKVQDAAIAALVIDAKADLEKIREQAQNIE